MLMLKRPRKPPPKLRGRHTAPRTLFEYRPSRAKLIRNVIHQFKEYNASAHAHRNSVKPHCNNNSRARTKVPQTRCLSQFINTFHYAQEAVASDRYMSFHRCKTTCKCSGVHLPVDGPTGQERNDDTKVQPDVRATTPMPPRETCQLLARCCHDAQHQACLTCAAFRLRPRA
jgi:hypothetical protein